MALVLTLFNFTKRRNSTAQPSGEGSAVNVVLKRETSLNSPSFLLQSDDIPNANYCKFYDRYYYIEDIVSIRNDLWELVCNIDVLGTYRANIHATTAFVEFCSGGHTDIMDRRVVPLSPVTQYFASGNLGISRSGCYILSVVGQDGCVQFACNQTQLQAILSSIETWAAAAFAQGSSELDVLKIGFSQLISQGNALDAVRSCKWIPYEITDLATQAKRIFLGNYDTLIDAAAITSIIKTYGVAISVPFTRTGWLRLPPYTDVFLYLPFVGVVNLNNPYFQANNELTINVSVNVVSGEIAYSVMIDSIIVGTYGGNCGASIDFGTTITPALNIANGIFQAATAAGIAGATAATGGAALASIGAANTVVNAAQGALMPVQTSIGGIQGGVGAGLVLNAAVWVYEHGITGAIGNMSGVQGLPYFNTATIGNLSGYVQTKGASVSALGGGAIREQINSMLDSGVFIE